MCTPREWKEEVVWRKVSRKRLGNLISDEFIEWRIVYC